MRRLGALTVAIGLALAAPAVAAPNIVGGTPVAPGGLPSMAYIVFSTAAGDHFSCTGTVIAPTLVLTAAHCGQAGPSTYRVAIGAPDIDDATPGDVHSVASTALDPGYAGVPGTNDAAVLTLATPTDAPAVTLAAPTATAAALTGAPAVIAGWGSTAGGQEPGHQLMQAPSVLQSPAFCTTVYSEFDPSGQLCAFDYPADDTATCQGDSGGPLLAISPGQPVIQLGITGFGPGSCDPGTPDFFTAVASVSPWVAGQILATQLAAVPLSTANFRGGLSKAISATLSAQHATVPRAMHRILRCSTAPSKAQRTCFVAFRAGAQADVGTIVVSGQHTPTGVPDTDVVFTLHWYPFPCRAAPRPPRTNACTTQLVSGHLVTPAPTS